MSLEFDKMCRTCLTTGTALLSLYESKSASNHLAPSIAEMLKAITSVEITNTDGLPGKVCLSCISEINRAFSFKIKCENSDFTLRQYQNQLINNNSKIVDNKYKNEESEIIFDCDELENHHKTFITTLKDDNNEDKCERVENITATENAQSENNDNKTNLSIENDDDRVSLIFAEESDFDNDMEDSHHHHHDHHETIKESEELFSIQTIPIDNNSDRLLTTQNDDENMDDEDEDDGNNEVVLHQIIFKCAICKRKFENNEEFQCHTEFCSIENDKIGHSDNDDDGGSGEGGDETIINEIETETETELSTTTIVIENNDEIDNSKDNSSSKNDKKQKKILKCPHCPVDFVHAKNLLKHVKKCHERKTFYDEENEDELFTNDGSDENDVGDKITTKNVRATADNDGSGGRDEGGGGVGDDNLEISEEVINLVEEVKHQPAELPECPYKCIQCGAGFAKEKSLNFHFKLNKCTQKQFECLVCRRVFITKRNLVHHMKTHTAFKCGKCNKTFSRKDKLKAHNDIEHDGVVKNQCSMCGKVFTMLSTLKDHLRTHSGEKPFLCSICGKGFTQSTNLKQHLMRHSKIKPYKCDQCENSFVSKGELNAHIRKHTGDHPFICNSCGAGFTTSSSLVKHRRIHTGERPYACEFCPMRFSALGTLKNHRRTHTGEKPFICKYCDRAFAQKSDCVTHMRTHTKEKPYHCSTCNLSFTKSSGLKLHLKTHNAKDEDVNGGNLKQSDGDDEKCDDIRIVRRSKRGVVINQNISSMAMDVCDLNHVQVYETSTIEELNEDVLQR